MLADNGFDDTLDFRRYQLVLGLRRKLGIRNLHRQHRGQTLASVIAASGHLVFLDRTILHVLVQRARHRGTKSRQVRAAVALWNVVRVAEDIFLVRVIPLHRYLDLDVVEHHLDVDDLVVNRRLVLVQMLDECANTAFVLENVLLVAALVEQVNAHAGIEEGQFAEPFGEDIVVKFDVAENSAARQKSQLSPGQAGLLYGLQFALRFAISIFLSIQLALAHDSERQ